MKFNLFDNGINSLISGIEFYDKYLNSNDLFNQSGYGDLKLAVICIHNSVEILMKYLLSKQNELLIYNDLASRDLLEVIKLNNENNYKAPLHYMVNSRDISVQTITYNEAINRLKVFIEIRENDVMSLKLINTLRNKITHFGIYREIDFYEVIGVVNNTVEFITNTLYPIFSEDKCEFYNIQNVFNKVMEIVDFGRYQEHEYWSAFYSFEFEYLGDIVKNFINDTEIKNYLDQRELCITTEDGIGYNDFITLAVFGNEDYEDFFMKLESINYPGLNITLIKDDNDMIIACIDHYYNLTNEDNKKILESNKPFNITEEELIFDSSKKQKKFNDKKYDYKSVKSILLRTIDEAYSRSRNLS
ncbi:hypothetical protein ABFY57_24645 [Paenibacillus polymyxa]|uniref:hypothetical protein n=1 Tax=Paenibacillus polymyxa TaxID=1406 RepID=UPI003D2E549A